MLRNHKCIRKHQSIGKLGYLPRAGAWQRKVRAVSNRVVMVMMVAIVLVVVVVMQRPHLSLE